MGSPHNTPSEFGKRANRFTGQTAFGLFLSKIYLLKNYILKIKEHILNRLYKEKTLNYVPKPVNRLLDSHIDILKSTLMVKRRHGSGGGVDLNLRCCWHLERYHSG